MGSHDPRQPTLLLRDTQNGDARAGRELFSLLYDDLRMLASAQLRRERHDHTLQPTALVHEAWFRLVDQSEVGGDPAAAHGHFLAIAARAMRQVLIDHARKHKADKRSVPAGGHRVTLSSELAGKVVDHHTLLDLDAAIAAMADKQPRVARIAELRVFGGLTVEEAASALQVSRTTAKQDWGLARALLSRHLSLSVAEP